MNYIIRKLTIDELSLLEDFLYEAIFVREGEAPPPKEIVKQPNLAVFIEGHGRAGDNCLIAEVEGRPAGAIWARLYANDKAYGSVSADIPALGISLYKAYRNQGIGTALLGAMLELLRIQGYTAVSISVQKDNYALRMYEKAGFRIVGENDGEYIMLNSLQF